MNISDKVINRLTLYHCILTDYLEKHIEFISSPQIASLLELDDSQVRKDLKYLNNTGKCRVGYKVKDLRESIEQTLGFQDTKDAFIVGAGNLGLALTKYDDFHNYGLNILALFDNDPLTHRLNVEMAILTVPRKYAQEVTDFIVNSGIKHIWNFTPCILKVPSDVKVWNENLMGSCLQFTARNKKEE